MCCGAPEGSRASLTRSKTPGDLTDEFRLSCWRWANQQDPPPRCLVGVETCRSVCQSSVRTSKDAVPNSHPEDGCGYSAENRFPRLNVWQISWWDKGTKDSKLDVDVWWERGGGGGDHSLLFLKGLWKQQMGADIWSIKLRFVRLTIWSSLKIYTAVGTREHCNDKV